MLHAINTKGWDNKTAWCVPTAISFLTGSPLSHSHSMAAFLRNEKLVDVEGVYMDEGILLLREQGYGVKQIDLMAKYDKPPTLTRFMKELTPYEKCMPIFFSVEGAPNFCHAAVTHYGFLADNWTMKPVKPEDFPHMRRHVCSAYMVHKL